LDYLNSHSGDRPDLAGNTGHEPAGGSSEADHCNRPVLADCGANAGLDLIPMEISMGEIRGLRWATELNLRHFLMHTQSPANAEME